jgi:hypothetical protein
MATHTIVGPGYYSRMARFLLAAFIAPVMNPAVQAQEKPEAPIRSAPSASRQHNPLLLATGRAFLFQRCTSQKQHCLSGCAH